MTILQKYQDLFDDKIAFRFGKAELFELIGEIKQWMALNDRLVMENKKLHQRILYLEVQHVQDVAGRERLTRRLIAIKNNRDGP